MIWTSYIVGLAVGSLVTGFLVNEMWKKDSTKVAQAYENYIAKYYTRKQPRARDGKFLSEKDHAAFQNMTAQLKLEVGKHRNNQDARYGSKDDLGPWDGHYWSSDLLVK